MKKIILIVGSMREKSFNRQYSHKIAEALSSKAEVTWLSYGDIPFINQDLEFPAPSAVQRVRDEVFAADGIWIVTPEYNSSYPGALKNLLDWLSRPLKPGEYANGTAVSGKKVTISGVAGKSAAAGSREKLTELLNFIGMKVLPDIQTGIALDREAFTSDCLNLKEQEIESMQEHVKAFVAFLEE